MRFKLSLLVALVLLALPATASADSDFWSTTITGTCGGNWSCSTIAGDQPPSGFVALQPGQTTNVYPGQTRYIVNTDESNASSVHLGWGVFKNWHIHFGDQVDFVTGTETRSFSTSHGDPGDPTVSWATRRVTIVVWDPSPDWVFHAVKVVHTAGPSSQPLVVRAN